MKFKMISESVIVFFLKENKQSLSGFYNESELKICYLGLQE